MTWKIVNNSDPGDSDHFGGDDGDKISNLFSGVDVDDVDINADWTFRSGKLNLRNPANTFSYNIVPAAIAADRTLNLPLITGTDTLATLGLAQTFTNKQTVRTTASGDVLDLENDSSSNGDSVNVSFRLKDSASNFVNYARVTGTIVDSTDTSEDGRLDFLVRNTDTLQTVMRINEDGTVDLGGLNRRIKLDETGLSSARTYLFPNSGTDAGTAIKLKGQTRNIYEEEDEFVCGSISSTNTSNSIGSLGWAITHSTGGTPSVVAGTGSHPGIIQIISGGTSGNNMRLHLTDAAATAFCDPADIERLAFIVRIPTITSIIVRVGLGQDISATDMGTAGAFFKFDSSVDADNWQTITRQASSSTTNTATSVTVDANDWFLLQLVRQSGGNWEFWLNNSNVFTHSATLPTTACNIGFHVQTSTSAARSLDIDYFSIRTKSMGQRWT